MIIYGEGSYSRIVDDRVLVFGRLKASIVKCSSLFAYGFLVVDNIVCDHVVIVAGGFIGFIRSSNALLSSRSKTLYVDKLYSGSIYMYGGGRPVIASNIESRRLVAARSLIDRAVIGDEALLGWGVYVRSLRCGSKVVFLDPYARIERFEEKPDQIIYSYEVS